MRPSNACSRTSHRSRGAETQLMRAAFLLKAKRECDALRTARAVSAMSFSYRQQACILGHHTVGFRGPKLGGDPL